MNLSRLITSACVALAAILGTVPAQGVLLHEDYFEYTLGDLAGQGKWVQAGTQVGSQCLNVVGSPLTYPGYLDAARGNAVNITYSTGTDNNQDRDCAMPFVPQSETFTSGKLYASFLINVSDPSADAVYSLGFAQGIRDTGIIGGKAVTEYGRLFISKGSNDGTCKLGIAMNTSSAVESVDNVPLNTTVLVVIALEFNAGSGGDTAYMWVNPATNLTEEPAEGKLTAASASARVSPTLGLQGFSLRQGTTATKHGSTFLLDALRIATEWTDLFPASTGGETPVAPKIVVKPELINLTPSGSAILQGMTASTTFSVRGSNLTGDITIASNNSALVLDATTVSAADAMSADGARVSVSYTATSPDALAAAITLSSEGATELTVPVVANVQPVTEKNSFAFLNNQSVAYEVYKYTGNLAKVSYVDNVAKQVYIQDLVGGIRIDCQYLESIPLQEGDKVKDMYLMRMEDKATYQPVLPEIGTVTSQGNTLSASETNFSEMKTDIESSLYRLVTVNNITLEPAEGAVWGSSTVAAKDELGAGRVGVFAGSDLADKLVPSSAVAVTGISTSATAPVVKMRRAEDLKAEADEVPHLDIESIASDLDLNQWLAIGRSYTVGTLRVSYAGLTRDADVWVGGTNRGMFSLSTSVIPAGKGTVDIVVTYTPTATGMHKATVSIDATPTELSASRNINVKAYDPANLPTLSVDASALKPFSAKVGETQMQTVSYTVTNGLDMGSIKVEPAGAFILSSASMLKSGTYNLNITYRPQTEGTHTAIVTFSTPMADNVELAISGSTTAGADPEQKQGDELSFGGTAQTLVNTEFTTGAATNTVLSIDGWKNVASIGTRAWWNYTDTESGNQMAKATLYDSKAVEGQPAQMVLLSPRLSYATDVRLLCFNIMGKFLGNNLDARLDVAYVDARQADANPANPIFSVISGLNIPATAEENGTWARYILDTENWQLDDEFYIAFILTGTRGKENAATYFVDDFSWGRQDVPFIRLSHQILEQEAEPNVEHNSEFITVKGFNLNDPIKVSVSGTHGANFTPSVTQLPAEGGQLNLKFLTDTVGEHNAVLTLSSGNSQSHVLLSYKATATSGVENIASATVLTLVDINGNVVLRGSEAQVRSYLSAQPGKVFIVIDADGNATKRVSR